MLTDILRTLASDIAIMERYLRTLRQMQSEILPGIVIMGPHNVGRLALHRRHVPIMLSDLIERYDDARLSLIAEYEAIEAGGEAEAAPQLSDGRKVA